MSHTSRYRISKSIFGRKRLTYYCNKCSTELISPIIDSGNSDRCPSCGVAIVVPLVDIAAPTERHQTIDQNSHSTVTQSTDEEFSDILAKAFKPDKLQLVLQILQPNDAAIGTCRFAWFDSDVEFVAILLQDRILILRFSYSGIFNPKPEIASEACIQLFDIKSTQKSRYKPSFLGPTGWHIRIITSYSIEDWYSESDAAPLFRDAIDNRISQCRNLASNHTNTSISSELLSLRKLVDGGILTEDDWTRAKTVFLGRQTSKNEEVATSIRKLHELMKAGVLTDSEFRMKKWDLLS